MFAVVAIASAGTLAAVESLSWSMVLMRWLAVGTESKWVQREEKKNCRGGGSDLNIHVKTWH